MAIPAPEQGGLDRRAIFGPFSLSFVIILLDQLTKFLIVQNIPYHTVGWSWGGDFLRIIHTRNLAIAFSIGRSLPMEARKILFIILPLLILLFLVGYLIKSREPTRLQRWAMAAVLGGGFGNIIDRIFRPEGVVDFVDVKFYGLFGLQRWPTFNLADSAIVVAGIVLIISFLLEGKKGES